jgi:hypothetical protein
MNQVTEEEGEQEQLITNQDGYEDGTGSTRRAMRDQVECLNGEEEGDEY